VTGWGIMFIYGMVLTVCWNIETRLESGPVTAIDLKTTAIVKILYYAMLAVICMLTWISGF